VLPLGKGDAVFFNAALFHGAGNNVSADIQRMANMLQVSSAFGRAMETVDRSKTAKAVYPVLCARKDAGAGWATLVNALTCAAEGYHFPTRYNGQGYDFASSCTGPKAQLQPGLPTVCRCARPTRPYPSPPGQRTSSSWTGFTEVFRIELSTFVEVAAGLRSSPCTVSDGLKASWVAEACTQSGLEHRPVRLDEVRQS
jgi:predicted dehydrogenase